MPMHAQGLKATLSDGIRAELTRAVRALVQSRPMEIADAGLSDSAPDVKKLYYKILAELSELRYANGLTVETGAIS